MKLFSITLIILFNTQVMAHTVNSSGLKLLQISGVTTIVNQGIVDAIRVDSTQGTDLIGIDVSHYQGEVNWSQVSQQTIHFVFIKSSQGRNTVDQQYKRNWEQTAQTKLLRGVYHFLDPSVDATAQAEHFESTTQGDFGDFPPVVDIEAFEKQTASELIKVLDVFISHVENKFGCKPMIYTAPGFWDQLNDHRFGDYRLWLADYGKQPKLPNGWSTWTFWQFENSGTATGITGDVDKSKFSGGADKLQQLKCKKTA